MSLGIDLSPSAKSCNLDCVYCELKGAKVVNEIANPPSVNSVIDELKRSLLKHKNIDVITLTANGEPSLYPSLKELIARINELKTSQKLLILSNGTGVLRGEVFNALLDIDIVKFSLDSAIQSTFKKIDRAKNIDINEMMQKMHEFRSYFNGELVLEILVVAGFNDKIEEFKALNKAINLIRPDRVDVSTIDRPPAYPVKGVSFETLQSLCENIQNVPVVIAKPKDSDKIYDFSKDEILELLLRRPQTQKNVDENFSKTAKNSLNELLNEGKIYKVKVAGVDFYKLKI